MIIKIIANLKITLLFLLISLIFQSCYSYYHVPVDKRTDSSISKPIKVITKDGRVYEFVSYTIEKHVLVGKDRKGNQIEIPKENIKSVVGKKANKFVIASFIIGFGTFLYIWYSFQKFSEIGI